VSIVVKSKENLKLCRCMKCPNYTFACKMKSLPANAIVRIKDISKETHAEIMYCAFEKSSCLTIDKGCICDTCEVFKEYGLKRRHFCMETGGRDREM
jgi:hypothetical protein